MPRTPAPPADPLADLRAPEPEQATLPPAEADAAERAPKALAPAGFSAAALGAVVTDWHNDTVAVGILHRGGTCGCHYLARAALRLTVEELADEEPESA